MSEGRPEHTPSAAARSETAEGMAWRAMLTRCRNPRWKRWYADRGITVCARWRESFDAFLADMGTRPNAAHSLDRIDNDRGYEPGNCRWATRVQQMRNTTRNRRITIGEITRTLEEWAHASGMTPQGIIDRVKRGWPLEAAATEPPFARGTGRFS